MASIVWRKNENGGWEESRLRNQRRSVEGSVTRSGSLSDGRRGFPGKALHEVALQRLAAGDQAVVAVGRRERRQEGECLPAPVAQAAANPDPVMVLIVRLFAAAAMTDDGVLQTDRALAQDDLRAGFGPIGFEVDLRPKVG